MDNSPPTYSLPPSGALESVVTELPHDPIRLREKLAGLAMASDACRRWLDRDEPNLGEVRMLIKLMFEASQTEFATFRR